MMVTWVATSSHDIGASQARNAQRYAPPRPARASSCPHPEGPTEGRPVPSGPAGVGVLRRCHVPGILWFVGRCLGGVAWGMSLPKQVRIKNPGGPLGSVNASLAIVAGIPLLQQRGQQAGSPPQSWQMRSLIHVATARRPIGPRHLLDPSAKLLIVIVTTLPCTLRVREMRCNVPSRPARSCTLNFPSKSDAGVTQGYVQ